LHRATHACPRRTTHASMLMPVQPAAHGAGKGRTAWPPMMMDQSRASFSRRRCTELYAHGVPAPPPPPPPLMPAATRSASARTSGANISVRATSRTRGRLLRAELPSSGSGTSSQSRRAAGERPSAMGCWLQFISTAWSASERAAGLWSQQACEFARGAQQSVLNGHGGQGQLVHWHRLSWPPRPGRHGHVPAHAGGFVGCIVRVARPRQVCRRSICMGGD